VTRYASWGAHDSTSDGSLSATETSGKAECDYSKSFSRASIFFFYCTTFICKANFEGSLSPMKSRGLHFLMNHNCGLPSSRHHSSYLSSSRLRHKAHLFVFSFLQHQSRKNSVSLRERRKGRKGNTNHGEEFSLICIWGNDWK